MNEPDYLAEEPEEDRSKKNPLRDKNMKKQHKKKTKTHNSLT